jgi:tRNA (guanine-N7-)-methyltransferase
MLALLGAEPLLENLHHGFATRQPERPVTKFERRALAAGRTIHDLTFRRLVDATGRSPFSAPG